MKFQGIKLFENRHNFDLLIEGLPPFAYNGVCSVKYLTGFLNQRKIKATLENIKGDWETLDENEIKIMNRYEIQGTLISNIYIGTVSVVLLVYMSTPFPPIILDIIKPLNETRTKKPLYLVEFFIDQEKYYYYILIHALLTSIFGVLPLLAIDTLLWNYIHHTCGMLAILRFCNVVNQIYSTPFFIVLTVCIVFISITGFATVIKSEENFEEAMKFAFFTIGQFYHLFFYNYMGQYLIDHSRKIADDVYRTEWYKTSFKTKYIVKFMLLRSLRDIKIQVKVVPLNMETFSAVTKSSMSYFTVLRSTR